MYMCIYTYIHICIYIYIYIHTHKCVIQRRREGRVLRPPPLDHEGLIRGLGRAPGLAPQAPKLLIRKYADTNTTQMLLDRQAHAPGPKP